MLLIFKPPFLYIALAGPIQLAFLPQFVVSEGSLRSRLSFGITGTSLESIPFSLLPLTYRQFQDKTGRIVENVFSDVMIPSAASDSELSEHPNVL